MSRLRLVSSNWRTMNVPVFAELFQWMKRRSSPGTYSRSAWKAMSLAVRSRVGEPSRSRMKPVLSAEIGTVRGCTCSSAVLGPDDLTPHQPDRVGAHGARRPDRHDPAPFGRDAELLVERPAAGQTRKHPLDHARTHRQLELHPAEPATTGVRRDEAGLSGFADHHPLERAARAGSCRHRDRSARRMPRPRAPRVPTRAR